MQFQQNIGFEIEVLDDDVCWRAYFKSCWYQKHYLKWKSKSDPILYIELGLLSPSAQLLLQLIIKGKYIGFIIESFSSLFLFLFLLLFCKFCENFKLNSLVCHNMRQPLTSKLLHTNPPNFTCAKDVYLICIASCLMDYEIRIYFLYMENIKGKRFLYHMYGQCFACIVRPTKQVWPLC